MKARVAAATAAIVVVLIVVAAVGNHHTDRPAARPAIQATSRPVAVTDPMAGLDRSPEGARSAALRLTALSERAAVLPLEEATELQRQVASLNGAAALVDKLQHGLRALDRLGDRTTMRFWTAALAAQVSAATADAAVVRVWYVGVLDVPGLRSSQQWRTVRYDLVWERGGWREASEDASDGPEPERLYGATPDDLAGFEARLAGFASLGAEL